MSHPSDQQPVRIALTNVYSYQNKGDAAIVLALTSEIERVFPNASIRIFSTDVNHDHDKYGHPVTDSLMWVLFSENKTKPFLLQLILLTFNLGTLLLFLAACAIGAKWKWLLSPKVKRLVNEMDESDITIACGGGYLGNPDTKGRTLLLLSGMCLSFLIGHYLGKPTYLYSQSIGPLKGWFAERIVRFSLNRVDFIAVREDVSYEYIEKLGVTKPYILTADPVFILQNRHQQTTVSIPDAPLHIGVTVRKWFSDDEKFENYVSAMVKTLDYLIEKYDAHITYIPQVIADEFGDDDRKVAQLVYDRIERQDKFTLLSGNFHPFQLMTICRQMDVFLGTRMHSNIFSLLGEVPVVAIMYEHKTQGIMNSIGLGDMTLNINDVTYEKLKEKADQVIANKAHYKEVIHQNLPELKYKSATAMDRIFEEYNDYNDKEVSSHEPVRATR